MSELSASEMLSSVSSEPTTTEPNTTNVVEGQNPAAQAAPKPWWAEKLTEEVEYGSKKIKEPLEMVFKRAELGYNYAQRAHQLNQKEEHYKTLDQRVKELSRWNEYDEYAKQNPDWAKHVEESWANKDNLVQSNQGQNTELLTLKQKLQELEKFKEEFVQEKTSLKAQAEDKQFGEEIESVGKNFGVDLSQSDEQGQTLEWRVLEHMKNLGLDGSKKGHFTAAFKDMYFDNLVGKEKESVKEQYAKKQAELKQAGIRGISRTPQGRDSFNGVDPNLSWNQLSEMALNDLRKTN